MNLLSVRNEINLIDAELLHLLNRRMELAVESRKFKTVVTDTKREEEVLGFVERSTYGLIRSQFSQELFTNIISESKRLQEEDYQLVGFQGEHGAYGEAAIGCLFPHSVSQKAISSNYISSPQKQNSAIFYPILYP